ncbi:MAG: hypothetical protein C5B50_09540 [Verrucomicrobia bacterium]|nr:MAG: hypothetical protein C5B50_09540 [Verrucomicrobiota bacterium]
MAKPSASATKSNRPLWASVLTLVFVLGAVIILFGRSFEQGQILFNNDSPLGGIIGSYLRFPACFIGGWADLNYLGIRTGGVGLPCTALVYWLLSPVGAAKFYAPLALLFLGGCAWLCFRQMRLSRTACWLAALAVTLNSDFLSAACWGVVPQAICFGGNYLALAALNMKRTRFCWLRLPLAGFGVGLGILEGADIGAIFSLFVGTYVLYKAWIGMGSGGLRLAKAIGQGAVVAVFAAFMAAAALVGLFTTQVQGIAGMQDTPEAKAQRWYGATQWSLPKREILGVVVPGLFGFRMTSSQEGLTGGDYWGAAGRDASWDKHFEDPAKNPSAGGLMRHSGGGIYAGVLVVLVAAWAGVQAIRRRDSVFSNEQRKDLWFWLGALVVSALLGFGKHAPLYQFFYALPGMSFMRNPAKFFHVFEWALLVVFAYGLDGLARRYVESGEAPKISLSAHLRAWFGKEAKPIERYWILGSVAAIGLSVLGWIAYASSRSGLESYLQTVQFGPDEAKAIAGFSIEQAGRYVLFLLIAVALVVVVMSGWLRGRRARWAVGAIAVFLFVDLGSADRPWIQYENADVSYASDPILERLAKRPFEHRMGRISTGFIHDLFSAPQVLQAFHMPSEEAYFHNYYDTELKLKQLFEFYDIQCLDVVQMPRPPVDIDTYEGAFTPATAEDVPRLVARRFQLTNTRYILGAAGSLSMLNMGSDPTHPPFKIVERFNLAPKPGISNPTRFEDVGAVLATNGPFALFEFSNALPRARLYSNWQVSTNDQSALKTLTSPAFDPIKTVLVANASVPPPRSPAPDLQPSDSSAEITSYAPTKIVLSTKAKVPSILLQNDRFDPIWKVSVDGKPETVLRCNYIMRGVEVPQGEHEVVFSFFPPLGSLYVTFAAFFIGALLLGVIVVSKPPAAQLPEQKETVPAEKTAKTRASKPAAVR